MGILPEGMNFWDPWPTWEKLTFALGCGIFFVFIIGFVVKFRNARQLRKLQARAATDLAERGEITERIRSSTEVPFGIRAIEAGCEVDGIWNSKAATPLQAPSPKSFSEPATPTMKPQKLRKTKTCGSGSSMSKVELSEPAHAKPVQPIGAPSPVVPSSSSLIRVRSNSITICSTVTPAQDSTHLAVPAVAVTPAPKGRRTIVIGGRSLNALTANKSPEKKTPNAIERMQAHRRQLRAESGQLQRRAKRVASFDIKPATSDCDNDAASRTTSWPSSKSEISVTSLSIKHEVVPLPLFVEDRVNLKKAPPTSWTHRTSELVDEKLQQKKAKAPSISIDMTSENPSYLNENHRIVNDGFEVLPAGSLAKPGLVKEFGLWPESTIKIVPDKQRRPTRKLQKLDRSESCSSGSRRSFSDNGLSEN